MTANLSGLKVEYAIALIYSSEAGKREATLAFDVGQGTQDLGFRGEVPVLFDIKPGDPGQAARRMTSTANRRSAASPSRTRPATSIRRRPSGWPRISSSSSRSTGPTAARCCCRRAN